MVGVIVLFLVMSINPSIAINNIERSLIPISSGNILYVGGIGPGNYSKIQDAIDNASDGDNIFVYSGTYYENIVMDKSINLVGESKDTTVIDGNFSGDVVYVSADWVYITKFTIQNTGDEFPYSSGIRINSKYNIITDNKILNNYYGLGIEWWNSGSNNYITGNNISNNWDGIFFDNSSRNTIYDNSIYNNFYGIINAYCCNNTITSNNIIQNKREGILLFLSNDTIITGNYIHNHEEDGIVLYYSLNITIECNNIQSNNYGLFIHQCRDNILIKKNNFIKNKRHADSSITKGIVYDSNYWDNWIGVKINLPIFQKIPKIIISWLLFFPICFFDWHPAKESYDIGV